MNSKPFNSLGIGAAFSPNLKANIFEAARLATFFEASIILIHVGDHSGEKEESLKDILKECSMEPGRYKLVFESGNPVDVILETVVQEKIDLLILGAAQRENILKYYVGSIARKITRKAQCSVLLLIKPSIKRIPCKHIVVNGLEDPKTEQTIWAAFFVARQLGAERITIVEEISQHKVAVSVDDDKSLREATLIKERIRMQEDSRVREIVDHLPDSFKENIVVNTQPIFGKRGYSIGHYAQIVRADLLVMNAPSHMTFWDRLFPHDIEHILTEIPTDVLIIQ